MNRLLVWDLPVRLFHWLLAGAVLGAFAIANLVDDESALFAAHMLLGGVAAFMVVLRVVWGFVGSRYARFSAFSFSPRALAAYLKGTLHGSGPRHAGHNPATSFAALGIFVLLLGLVTSGVLMSTGGKTIEELHEVFSWSMIAVIGAHVAGVAWHTITRKEFIALSMVHGRKLVDDAEPLQTTYPAVAVLFLLLTGLWSWGLVSNFDNGKLSVPFTGLTITIGEGEESGDHAGGEEGADADDADESD